MLHPHVILVLTKHRSKLEEFVEVLRICFPPDVVFRIDGMMSRYHTQAAKWNYCQGRDGHYLVRELYLVPLSMKSRSEVCKALRTISSDHLYRRV